MKFFYAQKDNKIICLRCRTTLKRGEVYVRTGYKKNGVWGFLFYHPECYLDVVRDKITRKFLKFKQEKNPPKKRGRPRKYTNPGKAQRLICLKRYHKEANNEDKVREIEAVLKEMEEYA